MYAIAQNPRSARQVLTTPDQWAQMLTGPADLSSDPAIWSSALVRHWTGTSPDMHQPPLDHHYIGQHLGGAKNVERRHDGRSISTTVALGALTIVPLGTQYVWRTRGPIEFAHLYLAPSLLDKAALHLDHARSFSLIEHVGCRQPLLESIFAAILSELRLARRANGLYLDCLLETFVFTLLRECSTASIRERKNREKLTAFRLARILEFIESNLDRKITLDDLVSINGSSAFHFSRAFKNSVGEAPHRFVLRRRIERAKELLARTNLPLGAVAVRCGFMDRSHFSKTFARIAGAPPRRFRQGAP